MRVLGKEFACVCGVLGYICIEEEGSYINPLSKNIFPTIKYDRANLRVLVKGLQHAFVVLEAVEAKGEGTLI